MRIMIMIVMMEKLEQELIWWKLKIKVNIKFQALQIVGNSINKFNKIECEIFK